MSTVSLETSGGEIAFRYNICTPSSSAATCVDPSLPTILFLHPVYLASEVFHAQFKDPQLRSFNLVSLDLRGHGETGGPTGPRYTEDEACDDVYSFIIALKLPPVYVFGLSMGTIIALHLAIRHPENVLGLFLASQLGPEEPQDVLEGREEIFAYWADAVANDDEEEMADAMRGALQLAFNNEESSIGSTLLDSALRRATVNWLPAQNNVKITTVDFITQRKPHSVRDLEKIQCPILLLHGGSDIAYPVEFTEEFESLLREASVDVDMQVIEGAPHFVSITHPEKVNPMLYEFVRSHPHGKHLIPSMPQIVTSPFEKYLAQLGYHEDSDDSDEEY